MTCPQAGSLVTAGGGGAHRLPRDLAKVHTGLFLRSGEGAARGDQQIGGGELQPCEWPG